jgi:type II secretory pathway pseudopilin PulG
MDGKAVVSASKNTVVASRLPGRGDRGYTLNEFLVLMGVALFIALLALPGVWWRVAAANENRAIATLRALAAAESEYAAACGDRHYTTSLAALAHASPSAGAILPNRSDPERLDVHGFRFAIAPGPGAKATECECHDAATSTSFVATAEPRWLYLTGRRSFAVDAAGVVWQSEGRPAPQPPFGAPAVPAQ